MTRNRLKNGFLTITAPAWRQYSPRPLTYRPCPPALLPLPTSSDYGLAVYLALFHFYAKRSLSLLTLSHGKQPYNIDINAVKAC